VLVVVLQQAPRASSSCTLCGEVRRPPQAMRNAQSGTLVQTDRVASACYTANKRLFPASSSVRFHSTHITLSGGSIARTLTIQRAIER
jgi:hypothetical protein